MIRKQNLENTSDLRFVLAMPLWTTFRVHFKRKTCIHLFILMEKLLCLITNNTVAFAYYTCFCFGRRKLIDSMVRCRSHPVIVLLVYIPGLEYHLIKGYWPTYITQSVQSLQTTQGCDIRVFAKWVGSR